MNQITGIFRKTWLTIPAGAILLAASATAVTPNTKSFQAGEKADVKGVIISREGDTLKVRGDDDAVETVDLNNSTKIELKHGLWGHKQLDTNSLLPGLHIEAKGKGNDKGDLVAERVIFDRNSSRTSRQIDTRVSPLEAREGSLEGREGQLEGRAGTLETRAGQIEGRENDLENTEKQTQQQVGQVRTQAEQANQGVNNVNERVTNLDNYTPKYNTTVYFRVNSATLSPQAKQDLDKIAQEAKNEKGYVIEVAGFADTTGNARFNQELSDRRADAVTQYLEEQGDIPIHRILPAAGLGTSHEAADNKTSAGRKLNRRVEVKVLVNQGLVAASANGQNTAPANSGNAPAPGTPPQQ